MKTINQKLNAPLSIQARFALAVATLLMTYPAWRLGEITANHFWQILLPTLK